MVTTAAMKPVSERSCYNSKLGSKMKTELGTSKPVPSGASRSMYSLDEYQKVMQREINENNFD